MPETSIRTVRFYDRKLKEHVTRKVRVTVDWDMVAFQLASKAWSNKSGKSGLSVGITVERVE